MDLHASHVGRTPDYSRCCHIRTNGARCTMPALYGKNLCYDHFRRQQLQFKKPVLPEGCAPLVSFAYMEDHHSILQNLNAIADAYARCFIDYRAASAANRLMLTALKTLAQMKRIEDQISAEEVARDVVSGERGELQAPPDPAPLPSSNQEIPT